MRFVADIETDGFLSTLTKIHCIALLDVDNPASAKLYGPDEINQAIEIMQNASMLAFHNGTTFDVPAIKKLYPDFDTDGIDLVDTLVLSRLIHSDIKNEDALEQFKGDSTFPRRLYGSHSLEAWGYRLGVLKGDFGKQTDWSVYTQEMGLYCLQDVIVCHKLLLHLQPEKWSQQAIKFEHEIAEICNRIGTAGWTFDMDKAASLYAQLALERSSLEDELQSLFPSWTVETEFVPKVNNSKLGYVKGETFIKKREIQFNPNSRKHIEYCLRQKYGWKPKQFTPAGDAKIDETILSELHYPEAKKLARSFMLQKRLGQLAEGKAAWMKLADDDGKLRHTINPLGTVTGRASSFGPNLQQVPATRAEFGKQCRELFTVPPGQFLVGSDLAGIELRCLAHFLPDGGEYGRLILNGDIHQTNADKMGVDRETAKRVQYATLYGSGDARLGQIIGKGAKEGRELKEAYFKALPAFATLLRQVKTVVRQRGYLLGLDGRRLPVRSEHAALNVLLQSAGALIAKKWVQLIDHKIKEHGINATLLAWVHDEVQCSSVNEKEAEFVGNNILRGCAEDAGKAWQFKIPIEASYSVGRTWADTH